MAYSMNSIIPQSMMQQPSVGAGSGVSASPFRDRMQQALQQRPQLQNYLQSTQGNPPMQPSGQGFNIGSMQQLPNYLHQLFMQQRAQSQPQPGMQSFRPGLAQRIGQIPGPADRFAQSGGY